MRYQIHIEDSYILFRHFSPGYHAHFCIKAYVTTKRTVNAEEKEAYKSRTILGIYQALKNILYNL